jgi:hypothetical protein
MDLSSIPLDLLKAEHEVVDAMRCPDDWVEITNPVCAGANFGACVNGTCIIQDACDDLKTSYGWPERKERYLMAIRAEIERRASCE